MTCFCVTSFGTGPFGVIPPTEAIDYVCLEGPTSEPWDRLGIGNLPWRYVCTDRNERIEKVQKVLTRHTSSSEWEYPFVTVTLVYFFEHTCVHVSHVAATMFLCSAGTQWSRGSISQLVLSHVTYCAQAKVR